MCHANRWQASHVHEWLDMHVFKAITVEPQTSQLHLTVLSRVGGSMYSYITFL